VSDIAIFVFRVGSLGDSIVALPAIKALNEHYGIQLYLVTNTPADGVLSTWEIYKHTNYFKDRFEFKYSLISFLKLRGFIKQIRAKKILYYFVDESSLKRNFRNYLFFRAVGFSKIYGWKECIGDYIVRGSNGVLTEVEPEYKRLENIVIKYLNIKKNSQYKYSFNYIKFNSQFIGNALDKFRFIGEKYLILGLGGKTDIQKWYIDNYVEVLRDINKEINIIILGGDSEYSDAKKIQTLLPHKKILNLCGKTSIHESAYILSRSLLYFGNDTGTAHLAGIVNVRCIVITSGRNNLGRWDPYGYDHIIIRKRVDCEGCFLFNGCKRNLKCMNEIIIEDVKKYLICAINKKTNKDFKL
jgi:ADP-heptose:LPS heptosyltransferase